MGASTSCAAERSYQPALVTGDARLRWRTWPASLSARRTELAGVDLAAMGQRISPYLLQQHSPGQPYQILWQSFLCRLRIFFFAWVEEADDSETLFKQPKEAPTMCGIIVENGRGVVGVCGRC